MTPDDLDRLLAAATPGPWHVNQGVATWNVTNDIKDFFGHAGLCFDDGSAGGEYGDTCSAKTRDAIVALRNLAPAFLRLWRAAALVRGDLWTMPDLPLSVIQNAYELDEALSELENHR